MSVHIKNNNWTRCPSTHCERWEECRTPGECSGTGRGAVQREFARYLHHNPLAYEQGRD